MSIEANIFRCILNLVATTIHTGPEGIVPKIRPGKEVTVTGKINRADITAVDVPKHNIDLIVPELKSPK